MFVLVAMGLMAILAGLFGTCGTAFALVVLDSGADRYRLLCSLTPRDELPVLAAAKKPLREDETLLVYYDGTVKLDMTEVSFATRDRLVYAKDDVVASMTLAEITKITRKTEAVIGDTYEITADDARTMRIEIAPLNNSDSFANALEGAWQKHRSGASITRNK